jgi:hypothetical protein
MNITKSNFTKILFALILFVITGCGDSDSDSASVYISSPPSESSFSAGEDFTLSLIVSNFTLNRPTGMNPAITGTQTGALSSVHAKHGDDPHGGDLTNPSATQGHVHIYLNDGSGMDSHITAWNSEVSVTLPNDLPIGMHSLRIEMRDDNHVPLGSDKDDYFIFEIE